MCALNMLGIIASLFIFVNTKSFYFFNFYIYFIIFLKLIKFLYVFVKQENGLFS